MLCNHNTMDVVTRYPFFHFVNLKTCIDPHIHNIHTKPLSQFYFALYLHTIFSPHKLYLPTIDINLCIHSSHTSNTLTITQIFNNKHTYTSQNTYTVPINTILDNNLCNTLNTNTHTIQISSYKRTLTFKVSLSYMMLRKIKLSHCSLIYFKLTRLCRVVCEYLAVIIILLGNYSYE